MDEAKKAVEFGFADDILKDDKNTAETEGYSFSEDAVERALINKIKNKHSVGKTGRKVDELKMQLYKKLL